MQGMVSMVVPCYNKEKYIGAMLNSVIMQEWDNIELILVNDGSTDRTRNIISEYEPEIKNRGYRLSIIDQDNMGCCAAVYAGLINMTGDYFCLVDCDDEIEPKYVSHMAGWLDSHDDCEWAACNYRALNYYGAVTSVSAPAVQRYHPDSTNFIEKYILRETITTAWPYMTRISYLKKCGLIENFCTERRKTYEPLIVVPLAFGNGKMEYFNEPLYRYNQTAQDLFRFDKFEQCIEYYDDYLYLYDWVISKLDTRDEIKHRLSSLAHLAYFRELAPFLPRIQDGKEYALAVAKSYSEIIDKIFEPAASIAPERIIDVGLLQLHRAIVNNILCAAPDYKPTKRVIGYGALGKEANKIIPQLINTEWEPTELWDINGDGISIKKPELKSLTEDDILLVFPKTLSIIREIHEALESSKATVLYNQQISEILPGILFPQIKNVRLK